MKSYDWIIVGGGIAGISIAEILSREGHSVALIEKNKKLASVATKGISRVGSYRFSIYFSRRSNENAKVYFRVFRRPVRVL